MSAREFDIALVISYQRRVGDDGNRPAYITQTPTQHQIIVQKIRQR